METSTAQQTFQDDPDNVEFGELIVRLNSLGLPQNQVANELGISQAQLSRVKRGERHAARKHVRALRKLVADRQNELKPKTKRLPVFSISNHVLSQLSATSAVEAFRDLLFARATSLSVARTKISVSLNIYAADGGVDASVMDDVDIEDDVLLVRGTRFQLKTGAAEPWQPSWVKKELFGRKRIKKKENLGTAVRRCLDASKRYVLVCFGVDLIPDDRQKAVENFESDFRACGYPNAEVEVWGQTQLVGLFHEYPSLCLQLLGHDENGFQTHESWARNDDMQPEFHLGPEQQELIERIRVQLLAGDTGHIRLLGEPGVGKSRLALEATRGDLAPCVLYFPDGARFGHSSLINELIQPDDSRFVVVVVDECRQKDRAWIWNRLKPRVSKTRLITIDHGPDDSADVGMQVVQVPATNKEQIASIIADYGIPKRDADRWAEECKGSPRLAHMLGENLRENRSDILQPPATVDIWRRFIEGQDEPSSEDVVLRKIVLRHVALFEQFGFKPPVESEAMFIANLCHDCDSRITWPRFQSIVKVLCQRRILQGTTTLAITPRLLHVYIYQEFWEHYGDGFNVAELFSSIPQQLDQLWQWIVEMLRYAHRSPSGEAAVDRLLGPRGLFPNDRFPDTQTMGRLIMSLAEASPKPTLKCLQRMIGGLDESELRKISESRQRIVWALEQIAGREDCFVGATELLLALAEAENATNSNNATGTFKQLFSLIPGMAATQATPARRMQVLRAAIDSAASERRRIALSACESALSTYGGGRMVGPEYQGLRKTIEFWCPETSEELWDAHRDVWQLLVEKLSDWEGEDRRQLISTLISSAWSTLHIRSLTSTVLATLESVAGDSCTDVKSLVELIKRQLRHKESKLSEDTTKRLRVLSSRLDGHDFPSRLRRFVKHVALEDSRNDEGESINLVEQKLHELAQEATNVPHLLRVELLWLVCENSSSAFCFAFQLAKLDPKRHLLPDLLKNQEDAGDKAATEFLSGYLAAFETAEWEREMLRLADLPFIASRYSDFVISSGVSDATAKKVVELCRAGLLDTSRLERWWFDHQLTRLSEHALEELIEVQLVDSRGDLWSNAVQMYHSYYLQEENRPNLPESMTFRLLTHVGMADERHAHSASYYWSRLAAAFLKRHPNRKWEFFKQVLFVAKEHRSVLSDLNMNEEQVLTTLLEREPERAWDAVAEVYRETRDRNPFGLAHWLSDRGHRMIGDESPGPIQCVPSSKLFAWVDEDVDDRGQWLAGFLPKTLDKTPAGRLTRDFIAKYGRNRHVMTSLWIHFRFRGWCGSESDHCRHLRDEAQMWLVGENDATVIRWIDDYIDGLSHDIERAEIDEERRF